MSVVASAPEHIQRTSEVLSFTLAFQVDQEEEEEIEEEAGTEEIEDEGIGSTWAYGLIGGIAVVTLLGVAYLVKFKKVRASKSPPENESVIEKEEGIIDNNTKT